MRYYAVNYCLDVGTDGTNACNGKPAEYTASSGTIQSPGYNTSTYPDYAYCRWRIRASSGNVRIFLATTRVGGFFITVALYLNFGFPSS